MALNVTRISSVEYLQSTVMVGDGKVGTSMTGRGLTAYYTQAGNPPGRWYGVGLSGLNVSPGADISSNDAVAVWQKFRNPRTNERLGKPPVSERKQSDGANDNQLSEDTQQTKRDVAGFDLTFTIPKDASILWALGDTDVQARIAQCHERALHATLDHLEDNVLQSRAGHGGVAAVAVKGLIAGQWDHWGTRDGEPHLHSHVVVSNRVQRASDNKWVTLDSRALYRSTVALSEIHQNLFMDELHRELGVDWTERKGVVSRAAVPDIVGMPTRVRDAFSSRGAAIDRDLAARLDRFREEYEREPSHREVLDLKQRSWRATRKPKDKEVLPLSERCEQWHERATAVAQDPADILSSCLERDRTIELSGELSGSVHDVLVALTIDSLGKRQSQGESGTTGESAAELTDEEPDDADRERRLLEVSAQVLGTLEQGRSTWTASNVRAEVERIMRMVRAVSPQVRDEAVVAITDAVLEESVKLTPTRYRVETADARIALRGGSVFDDLHRTQFTSIYTLDREQALLDAVRTPGTVEAPEAEDVDALVDALNEQQLDQRGHALAADQDAAVRAILTSDARMSVLLGPAGTGKTTTMAALREVWDQLHSDGSVIGLATSAQAASVLGEEIGTEAHTIAKWLHESTIGQRARADRIATYTSLLETLGPDDQARAAALRRRIAKDVTASDSWRLREGQLIVVDEASMTSTVHMHELLQQAERAGARMLLVGDHRQLDAVEAGGALSLLGEQPEALALTSVWRFQADWEKTASLQLREVADDNTAASLVDLYDSHDRIIHGEDDEMGDAAFVATRDAIAEGRSAILIASTNAVVADINERFMYERRESGEVDALRTVPLRGHADAGVGERILARHNERRLLDEHGDFIRNGTTLTVAEIHPDGSVTATRDDSQASIRLPPDYLLAHTELGYATTAHRSQGVTVDEARLLLPTTDSIPAELLYVGMTRGRSLNATYVGEEPQEEDETTPKHGHVVASTEVPTWKGRLVTMMTTTGSEQSAIATRSRIDHEANTLDRLRSEYEYLTSLESVDPLIDQLVTRHGLDRTVLEDSPVMSSFAAAHRAARAANPSGTVRAFTQPLSGVTDPDAEARLRILTGRMRALAPALPIASAGAVHGLTPRFTENDDAVSSLATQVEERIGDRITEVTRAAQSAPWADDLPTEHLRHIAIYRDLYDVRGQASALGREPDERDTRQRSHYDALLALLEAQPDTRDPRQPHPEGPMPHTIPDSGPGGPSGP
ncbi:MobF family relaxase [Brachybacterium tyrofermentans]|uniref:MobF family relaxase n=1 Tax=Brachybacterium tyrofermentans TaxID=47848 RepID=UPI003FCEFA6F